MKIDFIIHLNFCLFWGWIYLFIAVCVCFARSRFKYRCLVFSENFFSWYFSTGIVLLNEILFFLGIFYFHLKTTKHNSGWNQSNRFSQLDHSARPKNTAELSFGRNTLTFLKGWILNCFILKSIFFCFSINALKTLKI